MKTRVGVLSTLAVTLTSVFLVSDARAGTSCSDWSTYSDPIVLPDNIAQDFAQVGDVLYVGTFSSTEGLLLVDVSDPSAPVEIGTTGIAGSVQSIAVSGDYMFTSHFALKVLDVSDPNNPTLVLDSGIAARWIAAWGNELYVVNSTRLETYDISNPLVPVLLGTTMAPGDYMNQTRFSEIEAVAARDLLLRSYVDDLYGGTPSPFRVSRVDATDPNNAVLGETLVMGNTSQCGAGTPYWVNQGLQIATSSSLVSCAPTSDAQVKSTVFGGGSGEGSALAGADQSVGRALSFADAGATNVFWSMTHGSTPGLRVVDVTTPSSPAPSAFQSYDRQFFRMARVGSYVYGSAMDGVLEVFQVSGGAVSEVYPAPAPLGQYAHGLWVSSIKMQGTTAWILGRVGAVETVDVSTPSAPVPLGSIEVGTFSFWRALATTSFGALAARSSTVVSIDGSDPSNLLNVGTYIAPSTVNDIVVVGSTAHCATSNGYLRLDVSDPANVALDVELPLASTGGDVALADGFAYVTRSSGMDMLQLTPTTLVLHTVSAHSGDARDIAIESGHAYLATTAGLAIYSLDPGGAAPAFEGEVALPLECRTIAVNGDVAYLTASDRVYVADVSTPTAPTFVGTVAKGGDGLAVGPGGEVWTGRYRLISLEPQCPTTAVSSPLLAQSPLQFQSLPNPVRSVSQFSFFLDRAAHVQLSIHDVTGRRVAELVNEELGEGEHDATWRPRASDAAGVYFARIESAGETVSRKVVLLR